MSDLAAPSIALLEKAFSRPWDSQLPLHAKVHRGLRYAIENFFEDGQRFFTEKELIDHLKVSQVTVRRAVYDLVRDGLLERRVAKGSFVRKHPVKARGTATAVAIHMVDWDSSFLSQVLRQTLAACTSHQMEAKVYYSKQSGVVTGAEGEAWNQAEISSAILVSNPPDLAADLSRLYHAAGKTVVAVDSRAPGNSAHFVGTDNLSTTRLGLDHLTALRHKRICLLLNEPEAHENVVKRAEYFQAECAARGLGSCHIHHCGTQFWENTYEKAYQAMPAVMALRPRPTAVFAFDDVGAWAVLKWCSDQGISVPKDLSVLGFANDKPSAFTHPALTTIAHPIGEIARVAVSLLSEKADPPKSRLLIPELVVRESTAPAKQASGHPPIPA